MTSEPAGSSRLLLLFVFYGNFAGTERQDVDYGEKTRSWTVKTVATQNTRAESCSQEQQVSLVPLNAAAAAFSSTSDPFYCDMAGANEMELK